MKLKESTTSILKLNGIHFNELSFKRRDSTDSVIDDCELTRKIVDIDVDNFTVELNFKLSTSIFEMSISLEGKFNIICEDALMKERLKKNNTISILFPYIRSEVTLLTSQPEMTPVIIPPININKLIDESTTKTADKE
jgi:preprotein translocase subunit SecB